MKKFLLSLVAVLLIFNVSFAHQADAAAPLIRIAGGSFAKKAIKAMGEKAGMRYASKKQLDNQIDFINYKSSQGDQVYQQFVRDLQAAEATAKPSSKPGWKKYVLDPILWGTGLDILLAGYNAFKDAATVQAPITVSDGGALKGSGFTCYYGGTWWIIQQNSTGADASMYSEPDTYRCTISSVTSTIDRPEYVDVTATFFYEILQPDYSYKKAQKTLKGSFYVGFGMDWDATITYMPRTFVPTLDDLPEYQAVPAPWPDEPVEIEIPDEWVGDNGDDFIEPWNPPLDSGDPDDPAPDGEPEGAAWWQWLLKPLFDLLGKIVDSIKAVVTAILDFFSPLWNLLQSIVDGVLGIVDKLVQALINLFVPSGDFFQTFFGDIKAKWDSKIPIIGQLQGFFEQVDSGSTGGAAPTFEISLPDNLGGGTFKIIDFSYYEDYRVWILNFIRFAAWFVFLKRLYARIPRMIY